MNTTKETNRLDTWEADRPVGVWEECTEEDFVYSLEVLPPMHWHTIGGVESFKVPEPLDHRAAHPRGVFTCCASIGDRYFKSYQGHGATGQEITNQVIQYAIGRVE